jgi:hypothetical protein
LLLSEKQIPQVVVNIKNGQYRMEPLEVIPIPWAQGVGRSNRPAPTRPPADSKRVVGSAFPSLSPISAFQSCSLYLKFHRRVFLKRPSHRPGATPESPAEVSLAMYNFALYAIGGVVLPGEKVLRSR